jgi:hypothetical protein
MLQKQKNESETNPDRPARKNNGPSSWEQVSEAWGHWVRQAMTGGCAIGSELAAWWCQSARVAADPAEWIHRNPRLVCQLAELSVRTAEQNAALTLNFHNKVAEYLMSSDKTGLGASPCDEVRSLIRRSAVHWTSAWSKTGATWADYWLLPPSPESDDVR